MEKNYSHFKFLPPPRLHWNIGMKWEQVWRLLTGPLNAKQELTAQKSWGDNWAEDYQEITPELRSGDLH